MDFYSHTSPITQTAPAPAGGRIAKANIKLNKGLRETIANRIEAYAECNWGEARPIKSLHGETRGFNELGG